MEGVRVDVISPNSLYSLSTSVLFHSFTFRPFPFFLNFLYSYVLPPISLLLRTFSRYSLSLRLLTSTFYFIPSNPSFYLQSLSFYVLSLSLLLLTYTSYVIPSNPSPFTYFPPLLFLFPTSLRAFFSSLLLSPPSLSCLAGYFKVVCHVTRGKCNKANTLERLKGVG